MAICGYSKSVVDATFELVCTGDLRRLIKQLETTEYADLNKYRDNYDNTLLHIAVLYNKYSIIEYLLSKGMSANKTNKFNDSPLALMIKNNDIRMVDILVSSKVEHIESKTRKLEYENTELTKSNKRLRDDNDVLEKDNKRLRKDVDTYMKMFKKK